MKNMYFKYARGQLTPSGSSSVKKRTIIALVRYLRDQLSIAWHQRATAGGMSEILPVESCAPG